MKNTISTLVLIGGLFQGGTAFSMTATIWIDATSAPRNQEYMLETTGGCERA